MSNPKKESGPGQRPAGKSTGRKPSASKEQPPARPAALNLRRSLNKIVSTESDKIARALVDQAVAGNMAGARLIKELTQPKRRRAQKEGKRRWRRRTEPSEALRLAAQPRWDSLSFEEQKRSLIASRMWDFKHNCRRNECWRCDHEDPEPNGQDLGSK